MWKNNQVYLCTLCLHDTCCRPQHSSDKHNDLYRTVLYIDTVQNLGHDLLTIRSFSWRQSAMKCCWTGHTLRQWTSQSNCWIENWSIIVASDLSLSPIHKDRFPSIVILELKYHVNHSSIFARSTSGTETRPIAPGSTGGNFGSDAFLMRFACWTNPSLAASHFALFVLTTIGSFNLAKFRPNISPLCPLHPQDTMVADLNHFPFQCSHLSTQQYKELFILH